jgi:DNA helicase II / ATP-dependent DNA helicase PcrA
VAMLLEDKPAVRDKYARRFEHVLVDEFQDTNMAQYVLLKHLASFHGNIFVVGDTDQSIYRWRGADYRNVLRFEKDFPATQVILLEQNYRSTQTILDAAMAVIDQNPQRKRKELFTERGTGAKVIYYEAYDDRIEASFIVDQIAKRVGQKAARPGDFAIMYRTNAQSRVLEEAFLQAGLPYKLVGAQRFYGRREIKDVVAYLRLVHNPNDEISLARIINVPNRGIGDKTWQSLRTQAQKSGGSPADLLLSLGSDTSDQQGAFSGRATATLTAFGQMLLDWRALAPGMPPLKLMDRILEDVDYYSYINDGTDEGQERWENVLELRRLAAEFSEQPLEAFLERVALVSDQDTIEATASVPTLLTLHAAKGLEFPVVFIAGLDDGTLPHSRSFDEPEEMMEERRLLYVGITRAKDLLYLVYPLHRSTYGYSEPTIPSRFLEDIPLDVLDGQTTDRPEYRFGRQRNRWKSTDRWSSHGPAHAPVLEQRYHPGARVVHPVWGEGLVLNSKIEDDDEVVDIFFEDIGLKRVAASLAKLELKA